MTSPTPHRSGLVAASFLAAAVAFKAPAALALGNDTVFLRGNAQVGYDSNVFRISDELELPPALGGPDKSDTYFGLGAGIRMDLPVSRQRVRLDASATKYFYQRFTDLDYTGYGARGTWDWRAGNDWYGQITGGASRSRQVSTSALGFTFPRLIDTYDASATARYALTPRWELQGGAGYNRYSYDAEIFGSDDFEAGRFDLGAAYRTPRGNSTGGRFRFERGRWPNRAAATSAVLGDAYDQYTASAVLDWFLSGRSRLYGDIGYTWRARQDALQGDFNGPSGRLTYDYSLSGKMLLRASIYETRGPTDVDFATYAVTRGVTFSPIYQVSAKTSLQGTVAFSQLRYLGESLSTVVGQTQQYDYWTVGVSGVYQATRVIYLNASLAYYWRTSNLPFGDYQALTANIGVGAEF